MTTPESMQRLEELFHEAVGLGPQQRAEFIARLRDSNPDLVAELESLMSAHEQPDSLIDAPAYEAGAEMIADTQPALLAGQVVAHYTVVGPLGKGGMGEVYLANDAKLDRKVALKLLPAEFTNHKERLRRFIQEAKTASSLNHPNIITIHEIGQTENLHFIATEFIDGQTLKRRKYTKMELPEILEVSIQVAGALQAAHAAGIIHRDIKPENIMLRPDGYVKVLDFGLAKLTENSGQSRTAGSEIDTMIRARTTPGTVLGTVNYMSPEQARGQALDQRTDVFSLGVVMYELAAGHVPFTGATKIDTLVSLLEKEPPPLDVAWPDMPAEFQRIISKSLRKNREERYQTIKDLLIDLKSFKEELAFSQKLGRSPSPLVQPGTAAAKAPAQTEGKPRRSALLILVAVIVLAGLLVGGAIWWRRAATGAAPGPAPAQPPVVQRTVNYWLTVQKYREEKPYGEPFRLRDDINFEKDYQLRLHINSSQGGHLYVINEGPSGADQAPTFNVMFPSTTANHGSALLTQNQQIQIPEQTWFKFDEQQGTERIWLVWAINPVPELEAVKGVANPKDRGVISSPGLAAAVNQFLKAHSSPSPSVERDADRTETIVKAPGDILVHVIKLEHH